MLGPGGDVTGQRHRVPAGVHHDVAVVWNQCVAVQRVLDERSDVGRVGIGADLDFVPDVADTSQPGDRQFGSGALPTVLHGASQRQVAVAGGRLNPVRHGDIQRQRVLRRSGQHRVVTVVARWQHDFQVVVHVLHAGDAPPGGGGLQVLRVARHGAVERHLPVHVPDGDVCRVDERIEGELCFDCLEDIFGLAHLPNPFRGG